MNNTTTEHPHAPDRFLDRHAGRVAAWRATALRPRPRRTRREPSSAVRQVIVGHDLTWRPALSGVGYDRLQIEPGPDSPLSSLGRGQRAFLYNMGGSPAIGARYVYRRASPGWLLSAPVDVPVHGVETEVIRGRLVDGNLAHRLLDSIGATEALAGAIFCRDFLERRWCFPIPDDERGAILEPIAWRQGPRAPGWAVSPALWGPHFP